MADLLVVHDDAGATADDTNLINFLTGKGHTVTTAIETAALPDTGYDAIIVTESGSAGSNAIVSIPTCALPVMMFETSVNTARLATTGMTTSGAGTQWDLTNGDPFGLNAGAPDPLTVNTGSSSFYGVDFSSLPGGAVTLAVGQGGAWTTAWAVDTGGVLTTGTAPARRVAMGLITSRLSGIVAGASSGDWFNGVVNWLAATAGPPPADSALLLEDGTALLLESTGALLLE